MTDEGDTPPAKKQKGSMAKKKAVQRRYAGLLWSTSGPKASGIPRSKTRGLMAPRAKTAKIWPGHILKLQSVPNPKSPKI